MTTIGFVPLLWKVSLFLAAATAVALFLWRKPASVRHLAWSAALAGSLALPLLSVILPRWTVPVWTDLVPSQGAALFRLDVYGGTPAAAGQRPSPVVAATPLTRSPERPWAAIAWLAGSLMAALQTLLGALVVIRLRRGAGPVAEEVAGLTDALAAAMGIRRKVRVLTAVGATMPMTWGIRRPLILLPEAVASGDRERLRAVLLHELAHIARADFLLHLVCQAACAVYWFHPLVWLARRQALRLRERASDDVVLSFGVAPPDYASSLVKLSRVLVAPRLCGSLGICRSSSLESRVRAILDSRKRRGRLTPAAAALTLSVTSLVAVAVVVTHPAWAQVQQLDLPPLMRIAPPALAPTPQARPASDLAAMETEAAAAVAAFDLEKAAKLYKQAADVKKAIFGANSAQYAQDLIRLGALYRSWDRLEEAHPFYAEALSILEASFGPKYPGLAAPLYFLGLEAQDRADFFGAEARYQRVLELLEQPPSAETALAKRALAVIAQKRGEAPGELPEVLITGQVSPPATASPLPGVYRIGGGVTAPVLLSKAEPSYSREARLVKHQGTVLLQVTVQADGTIGDVRVVRSLGLGLDWKAVEALRQWRFRPGTKDGEPVAVRAQIEVNFRLL